MVSEELELTLLSSPKSDPTDGLCNIFFLFFQNGLQCKMPTEEGAQVLDRCGSNFIHGLGAEREAVQCCKALSLSQRECPLELVIGTLILFFGN